MSARVTGVQYDAEHILEYQLPNLFLEELDKQIFDHTFDHPDPAQLDRAGNRKKVSFCTYFEELWTTPGIAIDGSTRTPADHISDCYPTRRTYTDEWVVLEYYINSPSKTKVS